MRLLKGTEILKEIKLKAKEKLMRINPIDRPILGMIINGEDYGAMQYATQLEKDCTEMGIGIICVKVTSKNDLSFIFRMIDEFNNMDDVTEILIQSPLPDKFKDYEKDIFDSVSDIKLIDKPYWKMDLLNEITWPGTPYGIYLLLHHYNIDLKGKKVVVIGRSKTVGMPLSMILTSKDATVTTCHSKTGLINLKQYCDNADIIISAAGSPNLIDEYFNLNENQVIIDVGCNLSNGKLCGDVDFDNVAEKVGAITPVPGGVGPMTRAAIITQIMLNYNEKWCVLKSGLNASE